MNKITIKDVREYQKRMKQLQDTGVFTIGNFIMLGRQLRDKFNLTDLDAINILNSILNNNEEQILNILERQEEQHNE